MSIREKCLIHTTLKSDEIAILEKMAEHFGFLQNYYQDLNMVVKGKENEFVVIYPHDREEVMFCGDHRARAMLDPKRQSRVLPLSLGGDHVIGMVTYDENDRISPCTLDNLLDLCSRVPDGSYPAHYLVPDGIIVFDSQRQIRYANYVAEYIFYRLGYTGLTLENLIRALGLNKERFERIINQPVFFGRYLQIKQFDVSIVFNPVVIKGRFLGAFLIISDFSLVKKKEKELIEKSTVIKEIHHRVKNNLQTITSLLRLQMRRTNLKLVEKVFTESINRILSIALIHEALSKQDLEVINIKQTSYNILQTILSNMVDPNKTINGEIYGDDVYLSATIASSVSLCITELVQNAIEHAFTNRLEGNIRIAVQEELEEVIIKVKDNGVGVTQARLQNESSLGMKIVNTIIEHNLRGSFSIEGHRYGTVACIRFPKSDMEGAEYETT